MSQSNGKDLTDRYVNLSFAEQDHSDAKLSGSFVEVDFTKATLKRAKLNGIFVKAVFNKADLTDAELHGATFVNTDFVDAIVTVEQIRQATSLSNVKGPKHELLP